MTASRPARTEPESGNMLVLGLGIWFVVAVLILALALASELYAQRRDLLAEADSVALALADEVRDADYYTGTPQPAAAPGARLGAAGLWAEGAELAARATAMVRPGTAVVAAARAPDGTVAVTLSRHAEFSVLPASLTASGIDLTASARAELRAR